MMVEYVLTWGSAKEAFMWANEFASRPDCKDSVGQLLRKPGRFNRQDLLDQALTITLLANQIEHPLNLLYRMVYGDGDCGVFRMVVADHVAHIIHQKHEGREIAKLRGLATGILGELRLSELFGRPMRVAAIAKAADIPRVKLYRDEWGAAYIDTRTTLQDMLEIAERRMSDELDALGWLTGMDT